MKRNYDFSKGVVVDETIESKTQVDSAIDKQENLIPVRINSADIVKLKNESDRLGIPCHMLIESIVHRFASEQLIDRKTMEIFRGSLKNFSEDFMDEHNQPEEQKREK